MDCIVLRVQSLLVVNQVMNSEPFYGQSSARMGHWPVYKPKTSSIISIVLGPRQSNDEGKSRELGES